MATSRSLNPLGGAAVDPSPLLPPHDRSIWRFGGRGSSLRGAARLFRRASSWRSMTEPSVLVRETAAEQLEERQSDWAYSRPVVFLDVLWNLAFIASVTVVLALSRKEAPSMPLRLWVLGYALQCAVHMACVCIEYRKRHLTETAQRGEFGGGFIRSSVSSFHVDVEGSRNDLEGLRVEEGSSSVAKHLESANTMVSFIWWIIGFYWVSAGDQDLTREAPQLYWLCIVFLAFDVFFVVFCVVLACVVGIAVCCCLPCIIAILYAVADQEGATEEEIRQLPKYKFRKIGDVDGLGEISKPGGIMTECGCDQPLEHFLSADNVECCICLTAYDDGVELRELPCGHHFHCGCIDKWLYINATCPLCKYNIIKSNHRAREEV